MANIIDLEAIAQRLVQIQQESGLNAKDFCVKTDISTSSFSQIKSGSNRINVDTINKVVEYWGKDFSPMWFIFGDKQADNTRKTSSSINIEGEANIGVVNQALLQSMEEIGRLREALHQAKPKEIERITVFYNDNSVAHYKLMD